MDLKVLQYFLAVAREGSISAAASALHMTQPPLSKQIKDLEAELGKPLFIRGNRKISLTESGLLLKKRAEEMLLLMEKTTSEIKNTETEMHGHIYIGCGESEGMRLIAKTIKQIQSDNPNIIFHLNSGKADDVLEQLNQGILDFAIVIEPTSLSDYDFIKIPYTDTWGVLMKKDSPLAAKAKITPNDLLDIPLICSNQNLFLNELSGWIGNIDLSQLQIVATYNLLYNASLLVEEGVGYALCLDRIISTTHYNELTFRPFTPSLNVGMYLVWKKNHTLSKVCSHFFNEFQKYVDL
ncbi:MAG: LysR family transcriptional regulator [bacterium]|nr:LysR family transcriptional regulator [bacterium]